MRGAFDCGFGDFVALDFPNQGFYLRLDAVTGAARKVQSGFAVGREGAHVEQGSEKLGAFDMAQIACGMKQRPGLWFAVLFKRSGVCPGFQEDFRAAGVAAGDGDLQCGVAVAVCGFKRAKLGKQLSNIRFALVGGDMQRGVLVFVGAGGICALGKGGHEHGGVAVARGPEPHALGEALDFGVGFLAHARSCCISAIILPGLRVLAKGRWSRRIKIKAFYDYHMCTLR